MKCECEIGMVLACQVEDCSYNQGRECQAAEISVGGEDGTHAACDTFTTQYEVNKQPGQSMVEHCDITRCKYNDHEGCQAPAVSLGHHEAHAECDSFVPAG